MEQTDLLSVTIIQDYQGKRQIAQIFLNKRLLTQIQYLYDLLVSQTELVPIISCRTEICYSLIIHCLSLEIFLMKKPLKRSNNKFPRGSWNVPHALFSNSHLMNIFAAKEFVNALDFITSFLSSGMFTCDIYSMVRSIASQGKSRV